MSSSVDWRLPFSFAVGVLLATLTPTLPPPGWSLVVLLIVLPCLCFPPLRQLGLIVVGAGWFLFQAGLEQERSWEPADAGTRLTVNGTVVGLPEYRGQRVRFLFIPDRGQADGLPARLQVSWYRPTEYVRPGQRWELPLRLDPPHGRLNPGGFDLHRHLVALRIGGLASVVDVPRALGQSRWRGRVDRQRQYLSEVLQAETRYHRAAALTRALALADRAGMDAELSERLRRTGTAHLLAISGLHVGMVAGLAAVVGGWLLAPLVLASSRLDRRRLALFCALLAATGYGFLAGWTLPTQRALIMLVVAAGALLLRRGLQPAHALVVAFAFILLLDPLAPLASGFWLSFAAVAVLIWAFAWRPVADGGSSGWLAGLFRAQVVIAIGMLPLNVGVFQHLVPVAFPANLVAIPLVGLLILPSLLLSVVLIMLDLPATWTLWLTETGLIWLLRVLDVLDGLDLGYRQVPGAGLLTVSLALVGALWLIAPRGWPGRWLGLALIVPLLWPRLPALEPDALEMTVMDVGSGLAVLVRTADEVLLYDTGPGDGEGNDALGRTLPGLLNALGADSLDRLVVSHGHRAHAGGLGTLDLSDPGLAVFSAHGVVGQPCQSGAEWHSGSWQFRFLHPSPGLPDLGGNSACVLHVSGPGGSLLLTGGIDQSVEARLLLENEDLQADVLVLSASGHRRAGSAEFLARLGPRLALASVSAVDRSGRPHPELADRLNAIEARLVSTAWCGAITVTMQPGAEPRLLTQAGRQPRFWRRGQGCESSP
ncbi:MAG: DNA internalization-related competence protein ComEC/Rec2 [Wenzhouxiangella sp.]|nr:MAG: DNA internalization-related competence protein ComEC/Rec2 [Wenzhouxiangella sp.]